MLITVSFLYPAKTLDLSTCSSEYKNLEFLVCSCCQDVKNMSLAGPTFSVVARHYKDILHKHTA